MKQHNKIFLGLILGAATGIAVNFFYSNSALTQFVQKYITDPIGKIFLNFLIMMVIPLVFASLSLGVAQIGDLKKLGKIGFKTILYFLTVTTLAVLIGLFIVNLIRPGNFLTEETKTSLMNSYSNQAAEIKTSSENVEFGIQTFVNIIPRNPIASIAKPNPEMLSLIFFSLIVGVALTLIDKEKTIFIIKLLEAINDITVVVINLAMKLAPIGVFALIFSVTSRFGFNLIAALSMYVITVLLGLAIHFFFSFPLLLKIFAKYNPMIFFKKIETVILTAFSTSSSNATLPTTISVSEKNLGIPKHITGFVLPLGATMNMNGTALFEGVTVLFLSQVFGINLSLNVQLVVILMSVLTAIGSAGVPSGSIPLLVMVLAMINIPPEGIALILGVDRLLDMCRTVLNVTGDITCAAYIAKSEGFKLKE